MSSSSSSGVTTTTVNGTTRVTGLVSGIDVDSIVKESMTAEKEKKFYKLQQNEQLAEWRQDAYRTITSDITAFTDEYFSTDTSSTTSLLRTANYSQYTVTSSDDAVAATATSSAGAGTHTVWVSQLATAATMSSGGSISSNVIGGSTPNYDDLSGESITITLDDTDYTVTFGACADVSDVQDAIDEAVGSGKLDVSEIADSSGANVLTITAAAAGVDEISVSAPASGTSALSDLGFSSAKGAVLSNRLTTSSATLEDVADYMGFSFNEDDDVSFSINGTSFTFDKSTTIANMISQINKSGCGAAMAYDATAGTLELTAGDTGAGTLLTATDTAESSGASSNFIAKVFTASTDGQDAKLSIDGKSLVRSSNTVTMDGVKYTLNAVTDTDGDGSVGSGETATVSLTQDTDAIYNMISSFVDDYNSLIKTINDAVDEDYDSDYPPLTDDQKDEMSDEEITNWETKAKTGLLQNDSLLKNFLSEIRSALIGSVSGVSDTIFNIGLGTGDYSENGKLYIEDEDKLKSAIADDPDAIMNLFAQKSSTYGSTVNTLKLSSGEETTRYKEEGIAYRFYDIAQKYVSTLYTDSDGNKGLLVEKAGVADDSSESDNTLSDMINKYKDEIDDEQDRLDDYEEKLYNKYDDLESYINTMNTQLSALTSYLSDSSS